MKYFRLILSGIILLLLFSCSSHKKITEDYDDVYNTTYDKQYVVPSEHENESKLYEAIDKWLGTPYKYGGNTLKGVDCSGFVNQIYKTVYHINLERNSSAIFVKNCRKIKKKDLQEGDLVFFCTNGRNSINHVGIFLKGNKFVHASSSKGVIINSLDKPYYIRNYICSGRVIQR